MNDNTRQQPVKQDYPLFIPRSLAKRADLRPADKIVWAAIRDRVGKNDDAWPGLRRIGKDTGLSASSVADAVERLENVKLIKVQHVGRGINPGGKTNRYRLAKALETRTSKPRALDTRTRALETRTSKPRALDTRTRALETRNEPFSENYTQQQQVVAEELENCGVLEPKRTEILKCHPGLTVQVVKELYGRIGSSAKNPPAVLVKLIETESSKLLALSEKSKKAKQAQAAEAKKRRADDDALRGEQEAAKKRETEQVNAMNDAELERRAEKVVNQQPAFTQRRWRQDIKSKGFRQTVAENWVFRSRICKDAEVADDQRRSA